MARSLLFLAFLLFFLVVSDSNSDVEYSPPEKPNLRHRSLVLVNIWCLIVVFAGGISPYFLRWNEGFLVQGTKLASAMFLGTGRTAMMHLLSDANQSFEELSGEKYPLAFMLMSCGYLLVMFAGCVISFISGKHTNGGCSDKPTVDLELQGNAEGGNLNGQSELQKVMDETENHYFLTLGDSLLLIFVLCFHSVFEGIAIGVAGDAKAAGDWKNLLMKIWFQKIFGAIAMGIALVRMIPDRPLSSSIAYALAFAISSPAGVSIGIVIHATTQGSVADWIYSISIDLAYGAFIFISIHHLLSKGYGPQPPVAVEKPYHKFLALLLGIGVIALANISSHLRPAPSRTLSKMHFGVRTHRITAQTEGVSTATDIGDHHLHFSPYPKVSALSTASHNHAIALANQANENIPPSNPTNPLAAETSFVSTQSHTHLGQQQDSVMVAQNPGALDLQ
ncbi:PREDICTED: zinc transporter 2-like [Ipomoea nil]|uniref:zinc transporter 2-like n=1 Tax=Ipomoea nil TaxID=35883 RepID=UPI000900DECA|nr:PREDICTED: zinc transporter 2-like [Ipomoea nil]